MNGPPKVKPAARAGAAGDDAEARDDTGKHKGGRPPVQGNRNARSPSQPAPKWRQPAGQAALDRLTALWGPPKRPFQRRPR